jgi:hypothetical protein
MKTVLLIVVLGVLLGVALVMAVQYGPWSGGPTSIHMWIALAFGVGVSFLLGAGLMALSFHSHKRGYDDAVKHDD